MEQKKFVFVFPGAEDQDKRFCEFWQALCLSKGKKSHHFGHVQQKQDDLAGLDTGLAKRFEPT